MNIRRTTLAGVTGLILASAGTTAFAEQPDGVYSADQLLDADVYMSNSDEEIGEIDDIVFDNNMTIKSFVVETENSFGLAGKSYVVAPDQLSVETMEGDEATEPEYRVTIEGDADTISQYPVYNDSWWNNTQAQAVDAWQQTKESASNAWTELKEGTNNLIDRAQGQSEDAADAVDDSADAMENSAEDATN
ncbi:hypothetical protein SAOR_03305 [Salinisphaera orenii MK-B5]|uniref:PRC-barrel domain-containing protein n=2 Tax=Salinisphaera orenii TaxID=856731 RepID=A0A423PV58_9GAMM|nr:MULTISPECIES: PRC-barrel domain-containing protein [Salinisphaera]ROO29490.1 hypothetical protein SAOR_03305 [Salinisphaera orenii MK-B5]ROO31851.1 hypothetical protein SAHL_06000 [Salinisphaera halophila YIM 95161]